MAVYMTTLKSPFKMPLYGYVIGQSKIQIIRLRRDFYFKLAMWLAHWPWNPEAPNSSRTLTANWFYSQLSWVEILRDSYSLEFLQKSLNLPSNFSDLGNCLENRDKVWKNGKKSRGFFFQRYNKCFYRWIFFFKSYSSLAIHLERIMKKTGLPPTSWDS